jgi:hypothetical protein
MLLSNLTTSEAGSSTLLQLDTERLQGLNMAVLLKRLFTSGINYIEGQSDDYEHVASICECGMREETMGGHPPQPVTLLQSLQRLQKCK